MAENTVQIVWLLHVAATLFLVGLIWVVQVVHYPLFANVGAEQFREYERQHTRLITWLVAPSMFLEVSTLLIILLVRPPTFSFPLLVLGFVLLSINWLSTWLIQIPCHERLATTFDSATHQRLVRTNWIRTIAWTLRGILVLVQTANPPG
jgi:hypothetical protein